MEFWDVYDKNRQKMGKTIERSELLELGAKNEGEWRLVVNACVFNSKSEMLVQRRQTHKSTFPGMWEFTCGGSAISPESSQEAIKRELFEEVGISMDFSDNSPDFTINQKHNNAFQDFYLVQIDNLDITKLKLQEEEVLAVKWATEQEIFEMIDNGEFIPYYKSFVSLCFDLRNSGSPIRSR